MRTRINPLHFFFCLILFLAKVQAEDNAINRGINFYYQNKFDSSFKVLKSFSEKVENAGNANSAASITSKDSISLFQYMGMASAKLGNDSLAIENFSHLLLLDSLFRFPRNEDPAILNCFHQAQDKIKAKRDPISPPSAIPAAPIQINHQKVGFTYGAIPLGLGWAWQDRKKPALALGLLQVGGLVLSLYASEMQSKGQGDANQIHDSAELDRINQWQWTQRLSLTTALGAYLYSIIASMGD